MVSWLRFETDFTIKRPTLYHELPGQEVSGVYGRALWKFGARVSVMKTFMTAVWYASKGKGPRKSNRSSDLLSVSFESGTNKQLLFNFAALITKTSENSLLEQTVAELAQYFLS
jgi:hypothetical protein